MENYGSFDERIEPTASTPRDADGLDRNLEEENEWIFFFEPWTPQEEIDSVLENDQEGLLAPIQVTESNPLSQSIKEDPTESSKGQPEDSDYEYFISQAKIFNQRRTDVKYKAAIRLVRRYYRNLFKAKNQNIVKKRYANWEVEDLFDHMKRTLQGRIPEELITEDLVYYAIGILNLRKVEDLPCSTKVKEHLQDFLSCVRNFSKIKYVKSFKSENFRILWNYVIKESLELGKTQILKETLNVLCSKAQELVEY